MLRTSLSFVEEILFRNWCYFSAFSLDKFHMDSLNMDTVRPKRARKIACTKSKKIAVEGNIGKLVRYHNSASF